MKYHLSLIVFVSVSVICASVGTAQGPSFGRSGQPTTSPYLNLVPGSNFSPAFNYYRSYRPEREFRQDAQNFNRSLNKLRKDVDQIDLAQQKSTSQLGTTGHKTTFHNLGNYFPRR